MGLSMLFLLDVRGGILRILTYFFSDDGQGMLQSRGCRETVSCHPIPIADGW